MWYDFVVKKNFLNITKKEFVRKIEYAGYVIHIYPKQVREKAVQFYLMNPKMQKTKETIWIPKSSIRNGKDGSNYYGLNWLFSEYENKEKLYRAGYWVF